MSAPVLLETAVGAEWDLARIQYVREIFAHLGYPLYLLTILGIAKVLAVIGLVTPRARRVREWTYAGMFFVYAGAARRTTPSATTPTGSGRLLPSRL